MGRALTACHRGNPAPSSPRALKRRSSHCVAKDAGVLAGPAPNAVLLSPDRGRKPHPTAMEHTVGRRRRISDFTVPRDHSQSRSPPSGGLVQRHPGTTGLRCR